LRLAKQRKHPVGIPRATMNNDAKLSKVSQHCADQTAALAN
jgi:hypothetical protein